MKKNLVFLLSIFIFPYLYGQNPGFDQEKLDKIRYYNSRQLKNGLSVLDLQSDDSSQVYIRLFTDLPESTTKQYEAFISAEQQIRQNTIIRLPTTWSQATLTKAGLLLSKDAYGYFVSCPMEKLDTALLLLSQITKDPLSTASDLEKAKSILRNKCNNMLKLAHSRIGRVINGLIYGNGHPSTSLLSLKQIDGLSIKKYRQYYSKFYRPNNSYLMVISPFSADSILKISGKVFGHWKKKDVPDKKYKLKKIEETKIAYFDTLVDGQYELRMIFPFALHPFTFDYEKSELLSILIQKVLKRKLINETSLANTINASFQNDKISGNYSLNIKLDGDSIEKAIKLAIESMDELKAGNFLMGDLQQSKQELIGEFKNQKTDEQHLTWLTINTEINNLSPNYYAGFINDIENTEKQGVQLLANKYLNHQAAVFMITGRWYPSLNDVIKLSENYRIELYGLDGGIKRVIPKGFNGFHVLDDYVEAVGGQQSIAKLKDLSILLTGKYEMSNDEFFVKAILRHKAPNNYYKNISLIRPKKDTIFLNMEIYNGVNGIDSTMQGKKHVEGKALEILKYKSVIVPETHYRKWGFKSKIIRADIYDKKYVFVVGFNNQAGQQITDFYDVDSGLRYKRVIKDAAYLNERTILYKEYREIEGKGVIYPFYKLIIGKGTVIKLMIREINTKYEIDKKLFDFD